MLRTFSLVLLLAAGAYSQEVLGQTLPFLRRKVKLEVSTTTLPSTFGNKTTSTTIPPDEQNPHRIVGGRQVSITLVPWQVALIQDGSIVCGGTILSTIWVLSAAHCVYGFGSSIFVVRAGSNTFRNGGQARRIGFMAVHGQYNANTFNNDIAMLRTQRRFVFGPGVQPARIPSRYSQQPTSFIISGWGVTNENNANPVRRLRAAVVNRVPRATCARLYAGEFAITRNMICASAPGRDTCQGDSGGPVVSNGIVYGVVSFGIGCAQARYPGVYTSVRRESYWILAVARMFSRRSALLETLNQNVTMIQY